MNTIYISYDGMTDPLGQSQVIPYLAGLSEYKINIHLVSCEKPEAFAKNKEYIEKTLSLHKIQWHPIVYHAKPPIVSTIYDVFNVKRSVKKIIKNQKIDLIHCRSYISALVGLWAKKKYNIPFIFDMRGFWADERVDGNLWKLNNPIYKMVYTYFKKKEKQFLENAAHIVSLTNNGKQEILKWNLSNVVSEKISVIPCCADLDLFTKEKVSNERIIFWKKSLNITSSFVLSYLGSVGTWYMLDEMLQFFKRLLFFYPNAQFLFITPESSEMFINKCQALSIATDKIIVKKASRAEVPELLALSNISIFFIKPLFSKKASSPTKLGEIMSMGIPVICNSGVGDVAQHVQHGKTGLIVHKFCDEEYDAIIAQIPILLQTPVEILKNTATTYYDLEKGVAWYLSVYNRFR